MTAKEHSFLTDVAEIRQMEQRLLQLIDDFHCGNLQAFGTECSFEKMDRVRSLQEKLARQHFELDSKPVATNTLSAEERQSDQMDQLLANLQQLSSAIQSLHPKQHTGKPQ